MTEPRHRLGPWHYLAQQPALVNDFCYGSLVGGRVRDLVVAPLRPFNTASGGVVRGMWLAARVLRP